jgi:hypothetical protein
MRKGGSALRKANSAQAMLRRIDRTILRAELPEHPFHVAR